MSSSASAVRRTLLLLASTSPRRHGLLKEMGVGFLAAAPKFDEDLPHSTFASPGAYATATATGKAEEVAARVAAGAFDAEIRKMMSLLPATAPAAAGPESTGRTPADSQGGAAQEGVCVVVLAVDTIIARTPRALGSAGGPWRILEKAADHSDAVRMWTSYMASTATVTTSVVSGVVAVKVMRSLGATTPSAVIPLATFTEETEVLFRSTEGHDDAAAIVSAADALLAAQPDLWRGKAGAFGVQDPSTAAFLIAGIRGCYYNVVGLPIFALRQRVLAPAGIV